MEPGSAPASASPAPADAAAAGAGTDAAATGCIATAGTASAIAAAAGCTADAAVVASSAIEVAIGADGGPSQERPAAQRRWTGRCVHGGEHPSQHIPASLQQCAAGASHS